MTLLNSHGFSWLMWLQIPLKSLLMMPALLLSQWQALKIKNKKKTGNSKQFPSVSKVIFKTDYIQRGSIFRENVRVAKMK